MILTKRKRRIISFATLLIFVVVVLDSFARSHRSSNFNSQEMDVLCSKERCVSNNFSIRWAAMFNYAARYKIVNCAIQKSLSTLTMAIMCYLYNEKRFEAENRTIPGESWNDQFCRFNNAGVEPSGKLLHDPQWTHFAIVREPIERFLSGWMDKCHK